MGASVTPGGRLRSENKEASGRLRLAGVEDGEAELVATQTELTKCTMKLFGQEGYQCVNVETMDRFSKHKKDFLGFIDILALTPQPHGRWGRMAGLQVTSRAHRAERRLKILSAPLAKVWTDAGGTILLVTWDTKGQVPGAPMVEQVCFGKALAPLSA
jgi:hypothetical protein